MTPVYTAESTESSLVKFRQLVSGGARTPLGHLTPEPRLPTNRTLRV